MLNRLIETIRQIAPAGGFEGYLMNLHRSKCPGVPSLEEARRDYQTLVRRDSQWVA